MTDSFDVEISGDYDGIDFEAIASEELDRAAVRTVNEWTEKMREAGYRNTGDTINSVTWEAPSALERLVGSDRIAALIGEVGRAPGSGHPNVDQLADWVHEQAGLPNRGTTVEWEFGGETQTVHFDQAVYLIGRAIDANGLPAHRFGERALQTVGPEFEQRLAERLQEAIDEQST